MSAATSALVIGGGIAGPVAALALHKAGIEATVYEAHPASGRPTGAMLSLAPNGLDALGLVGAEQAVCAVGQPMRRTVIADGKGRTMATFPGLPDLQPSQALWRAALHRALHEHATTQGISIIPDKRLLGVHEAPTAVTATFADGAEASADILIAADGIHSTVRRIIDPDAPSPRHVPLLNFGGVSDMVLPVEPDTTYFVFGSRGFLGYWRQADDTTAWFANLPEEEPMSLAEARAIPSSDWLSRLAETYASDTPGSALIAGTSPRRLQAFGSVEIMPSVPRWHTPRMVLVGDAVHAPSPSSGQGASLAIESAVELARCLRDRPNSLTAFETYEQLRRPRVEKVAARAAKTNASKTLGPAALRMMRIVMPLATRTLLTPERSLGAEQRFRIDWDARAGAST